jgi:hypothetical protein
MKEKKIDALLALASFSQLLLLGFGGAFASELISEYPREKVIYFGSMFSLIFLLATIYFYVTIFSLVNKK